MSDEGSTEAEKALATLAQDDENRKRLTSVADDLKREMEILSCQVRDLTVEQPPIQLLGYIMSQLHLAIMSDVSDAGEDHKLNKDTLETFQFVLEYVHAVWSCHADLADEHLSLDEKKVGSLFNVLDQLQASTRQYCMVSSAANIDRQSDRRWDDVEFLAKSSWTLIRGHRYQVLEEEFFRFVLAPHAEALQTAYSMEPDEIAVGVQGIANAMRTGFSSAAEKMLERMDQAHELATETGEDLGAVTNRLLAEDPALQNELSGNMKDMLFGGTCNLSKHTSFTQSLLEDLSYAPGENTEFYAPGDFSGTPMRTLPGRVKPAIRLGGEVYATDGQFVRDSAYRAIQRGVCSRLHYRDEWLKRQAVLGPVSI